MPEAAPNPMSARRSESREWLLNEILHRITSELLATHEFDARLSLILDTLLLDLGYKQAAIALVDEAATVLDVRAALGFSKKVEDLSWGLNSGLPLVEAVRRGEAIWFARSADGQAAEFLDAFGCASDLLALPLLYAPHPFETRMPETSGSGALDLRRGNLKCSGVIFVGASRRSLSRTDERLLKYLAEQVAFALAIADRHDRLAATVGRLQRERQWIDSILKSVADPIVLTNLDNNILLQNRRAEEFFTASEEAAEGKLRALKINDILFSAYLSSAGFSEDVTAGDLTLVDPIEGTDVHFEVVSTPAVDANGHVIGLVSIFRNVTDLRRAHEEMLRNYQQIAEAEAQARRERDRLDLVIENVGHPIVVSNASGDILLSNRRAESFFHYAESSSRSVAPVRANSVKLTSFITSFASDPLASRKAEVYLANPVTGEMRPMEITAVKIADSRGQLTAVVSILHDLSEVRELERRRVEQKLFESQKLAAIGRLTASIAHEINNPLEAIKNSLYLQREVQEMEAKERFLGIAFKETERMSQIVKRMLGFARVTGEAEWVDVNSLIEETLVLVEKKLKQSDVKVVRALDKDLPAIRARPDQLRQVFLNMILNAQQAIEGSGKIRIRTAANQELAEPSIVIQISDTGCGISEEHLGRIFEPFFSTGKKGTGLGLWVTQDIIRLHGGRIEVSSAVNKGTTFRILLPVEGPAATGEATREPLPEVMG